MNCCNPRDDWWSIDDEEFKSVIHVLQASIGAMKIRVKNEIPATRLFLLRLTNPFTLFMHQVKYRTKPVHEAATMSTILMDNYLLLEKSVKLTIVIWVRGTIFGLLKKVVPANKHITSSSSGSANPVAVVSSIIITTSTTR